MIKEVAIKDICNKDSSALKQKELLSEGKYPVYGASGIAGYLDSYQQENEYIGIVKDGSGIGRVAFYPEKTSLIGTMQYILPKKGFNIRYIGYCLQSLDLSKYKQGAAIPHIYFSDYGERLVNVTNDENEQLDLVLRLDVAFEKIDSLRANIMQQLDESRALFNRTLTKEMTPKKGWEEKKLSSVCEINRGRSKHRPRNDQRLYGGIYPFIQTGDIRNANGGLLETYSQTYSDFGLSQSRLWKKGTICMTIAANIGETAILGIDACFPDSVVGIRPNDTLLDPHFLNYYLMSIKKGIDSMSYGTAQKNINLEVLNNIIIYYPKHTDEQHAIVKRLDDLNKNIKRLEKVLNKIYFECDALKQAMLREVFE